MQTEDDFMMLRQEFDDLKQEVRSLRDKEEIRSVIYRYNRAVDRLDRELLISCYHEDAVDDHGPYFKGNREDFADYAIDILEECYEASFYQTGTMIIELDGDSARCESYCFAPKILKAKTDQGGGQMWLVGARFLDRLERRDGQWRIAHRSLIGEWEVFVPMQTETIAHHVFPKEPHDGPVARRDREDPSYTF